MLPNVGFSELLLILLLVLLIFGAKRLPEVAKAIGQSFHAFKDGLKDIQKETEPKPQPPEIQKEKKE